MGSLLISRSVHKCTKLSGWLGKSILNREIPITFRFFDEYSNFEKLNYCKSISLVLKSSGINFDLTVFPFGVRNKRTYEKIHPVPHDLSQHFFNRINSIWRWKKSNLSGALKHRLAELFNPNCTPNGTLVLILLFRISIETLFFENNWPKNNKRKLQKPKKRDVQFFVCSCVCVCVRVKVYIWIWHCLNIRGTSMHAIDTYMRIKSRVPNEKWIPSVF